jgi:hypothetical protein
MGVAKKSKIQKAISMFEERGWISIHKCPWEGKKFIRTNFYLVNEKELNAAISVASFDETKEYPAPTAPLFSDAPEETTDEPTDEAVEEPTTVESEPEETCDVDPTGETEDNSDVIHNGVDDRFEEWWNLYDKKTGKKDAQKKWAKLNQPTRNAVIAHSSLFVKAKPDPQFRKDPIGYLNGEHYNDELSFPDPNNMNSFKQLPIAEVGISNKSKAAYKESLVAWCESFENGDRFAIMNKLGNIFGNGAEQIVKSFITAAKTVMVDAVPADRILFPEHILFAYMLDCIMAGEIDMSLIPGYDNTLKLTK